MSILDRIIGRLHSVFNKDPKRVHIATVHSMPDTQWEFKNNNLKLITNSGTSDVTLTGTQTVTDLATTVNEGDHHKFSLIPAYAIFQRNSVGVSPYFGDVYNDNTIRGMLGKAAESMGFIVEESTTNILSNSKNSSDWTDSGTTRQTGTTITPSSIPHKNIIVDYILVNETNYTGFHYIDTVVSKAAAALTYTFSVKATKAYGRYIILHAGDPGDTNYYRVNFDLNTGAMNAGTPVTFSACSATVAVDENSNYKLTITFTTDTASDLKLRVYTAATNSATPASYTGINAAFYAIFGMQLEQKAYQTTIAPTIGASLTREAEILKIPAEKVTASSGTIAFWVMPYTNATNRRLFSTINAFSDASHGIDLYMKRVSGSDYAYASVGTGTTAITQQHGTALVQFARYHVVLTYDADGIRLWVNGTAAGAKVAGAVDLRFGAYAYLGCSEAGEQSNSSFDNYRIYNTVLTDTQIANLYNDATDYTLWNNLVFIAGYSWKRAEIEIANGYGSTPYTAFMDAGRTTVINQPHIDTATSILYSEMTTYAKALEQQQQQIASAELEMAGNTADGEWLEYWFATHFGIHRTQGETDIAYYTRAKYEILAIRSNNKALEKLVYDALGIKISLIDAYGVGGTSAPYIGRFYADGLPYDANQTTLRQQIKDVVDRSRAAGTELLQRALESLLTQSESVTASDSDMAATITATLADELSPGYIYIGTGWIIGSSGVKIGVNSAILEEVVVSKILVSDGSVVAQYYLT